MRVLSLDSSLVWNVRNRERVEKGLVEPSRIQSSVRPTLLTPFVDVAVVRVTLLPLSCVPSWQVWDLAGIAL